MENDLGQQLLTEWIADRLDLWRSSLVQKASGPAGSVFAALAGNHHLPSEFFEQMYGIDQKTYQFHAWIRLVASDPTFQSSERQYRKYVFLPSAALRLIIMRLECCIDHLNPQPNADIIREHASKGGFPVTSINEVKRIIDPTTADDSQLH